jgi:hypothetical protein
MEHQELIKVKKRAKVLIQLNENYHKYLYLGSFTDIKKEKNRLVESFGLV